MSNAQRKSNPDRMAAYVAQNGTERPDAYTGPQNRRITKHRRRALQTPDERTAIVARRSRVRQTAEAFGLRSTGRRYEIDVWPLGTDGKGKPKAPVTRTDRRLLAKWERKRRGRA